MANGGKISGWYELLVRTPNAKVQAAFLLVNVKVQEAIQDRLKTKIRVIF
jgi:hypothetical protein